MYVRVFPHNSQECWGGDGGGGGDDCGGRVGVGDVSSRGSGGGGDAGGGSV